MPKRDCKALVASSDKEDRGTARVAQSQPLGVNRLFEESQPRWYARFTWFDVERPYRLLIELDGMCPVPIRLLENRMRFRNSVANCNNCEGDSLRHLDVAPREKGGFDGWELYHACLIGEPTEWIA